MPLNKEIYGLTINQAANTARVSKATIRNWIKTKYLTQLDKGFVSRESLARFMSETAGKEKLNSRANKLLKDRNNHAKVSQKMDVLIKHYTGENMGLAYENSLSGSYRNQEGIYYTPVRVVKDMFARIKINPKWKFLDPCCGSGNFIIEAIRHGVSPENVYGFDTDANAVLITKQRLKNEFGFDAVTIKQGDFLEKANQLAEADITFDLIFTNPPWGKKIKKINKEKYAALYKCGHSLDTTSLFLGAGLSLLKPNGYLGFLIQEAFFNIAAFEDIRKKVLSKKILCCVDYGKVFKGLMAKAQAIVIENTRASNKDPIECCIGNTSHRRTLGSFTKNAKHILNFWAKENEAQVINRLYTVTHTTLKDKASWALGIVTGNNAQYCSNKPKEGYIPVYRGSDITKTGFKQPKTYILNNFSNFQQVAPVEMYQAEEKLVYKFISSDLCFYCDTQQKYILNSANLLIPKNLNITAKQLANLLNSEIMNWLFKKLFSTCKVLRGDLELLPIHFEYFSKNHKFVETDYLNYLQITKTSYGTYKVKN